MSRVLHSSHHLVRADCDDPIHFGQRHERFTKLTMAVSLYRLNNISSEMPVLRTMRHDRGAGIRTPDDLICCSFNLFALEKIFALLVTGKIDDTISVLSHRLRDRE